jgi:hypothetical protein
MHSLRSPDGADMPEEKKYTVEVPRELPRRKREILNRMICVFNAYGGKVPKGLLDAIDEVIACGIDTDAECERLEALLDRWARLH